MSWIRLLGVVIAGLLIGIAVATADGRVKQRYEDLYRSHLRTVAGAGENLGKPVLLENVVLLKRLSNMCRDPEPAVRALSKQMAGRAKRITEQKLDDIQPRPMGKWFEDSRWYTRPSPDGKVVTRGLREFRAGVEDIKRAYLWAGFGYAKIASGTCDVSYQRGKVADYHISGIDKIRAGIRLLRSLLH